MDKDFFEDEVENNDDVASKVESAKAAKREAAKRWKEKKAAEKQEFLKKSAELNAKLKANGIWEQLDEEDKVFLEYCANPVTERKVTHASVNNMFNILFGENPDIGDSVTLMEVFQKTLKGKAQFDAKVKSWAATGIILSYAEDASNMFNSTYTIEQLPADN